jgi:hypothetical protein
MTPAKVARVLLLTVGLFSAFNAYAQRERQIQPADESLYGRRFFVQLRSVFGRFRETDLQRAFEKAQPIQCSELVNETGEWRTVAFFNEKRELGDWYRASFDEVKSDLAVFTFKGICRGESGPVQLTTRFPVAESIEAYQQKRIALEEVDVNVNVPVRASFDLQTQAYSFDLPYLFLISEQDGERLYSLAPPRLADRYAPDVIDHWDCKSVTAENLTYRFLICRTTTLPRNPAPRNQDRTPTFGASAYFILSDGKEASSSVKLTFNDANDAEQKIEDASVKPSEVPASPSSWESPDADEKLLDVVRSEFRIRFNAETWAGRIGAAQGLAAQQLSRLQSFNPAQGADYCVWLPAAASSTGEPVQYLITAHDRDGQSPTSIKFDMRMDGGRHLGSLQCFFPRAASAVSINFSRWTSIVGRNFTMDVRP